MRRGLLTYFMLLCCFSAALGQSREESAKKFTFGVEQSYAATLYSYEYHYFKNHEGAREVIDKGSFIYDSDSEFNLHCGYNFNSNWNLSLYTGYTGIGKFHKAVPISIRATRYFGDNPLKDRWFTFLDAGTGISIKSTPDAIIAGKVGAGYRLSLSKSAKLDFLCALRVIRTHPDISDYDQAAIPENVFLNEGIIGSLAFGIGLTF